jgi:zinc protease
LSVATGAALALAAVSPSQAAAKIQHLVSPGGIEAWFVQDATVPLIAMEYSFAGGSSQDPKDKPGVANLVGDLLDEGSGDLDSKTFHERLDRRAIELSFSATRDTFRGSLRMLRDNKDEAFDLLRSSLTSPHFDTADVERIRSQVISGLRRDTTNPSSLASRKFLEMAFGDHPYGQQTTGTLESVPTITVADMKDYVGRNLAKDTLKIAVVGDVDPATLGKLLDHTFGSLPAKANLVSVPDVEAAKPPQRAFVPLDVPQTVITFGGPGVKRSDPNFMAAYVVIPCSNRCSGWSIRRSSSATPAPVPTAPATPWMRSRRKCAALPTRARRRRSSTRPSPTSRARRCWRSTPPPSSRRRCCNISRTSCRSTISRSATASSTQ